MSRTLRLGRCFGIGVQVHVSWLVVYAFVTAGVTASLRRVDAPAPVALAAVAALALFASVLVHEFAHALVARRFGVRTRAITLFLFGGVAVLEEEPPTAGADALVALAGPAASAALAGLAFGALWIAEHALSGSAGVAVGLLLGYLAMANAVLAAFNLVPAYPTDGGRVLRAIVWARTGSLRRATRGAARIGYVLAAALAAAGVGLSLADRSPWFLWYVALAGFLAAQSRRQVRDAADVTPLPRREPLTASFAADGTAA